MSCNRQARTGDRAGVRAFLPILAVMLVAAVGASVQAGSSPSVAPRDTEALLEQDNFWECVKKRLQGLPCDSDAETPS